LTPKKAQPVDEQATSVSVPLSDLALPLHDVRFLR
jgi:hypothetical protein